MHRILIVEDDPSLTKLYEALLKPKYEILILESGKDLLQRLERFQPDLVVLDVDLGTYEDGFDLSSKLQKKVETKRIPILFVTGQNSPDALRKGFQTGAVDYLTKPFQPFELLARCEHRIRKSQEAFEENSELAVGPIRLNILKRVCFLDDKEMDIAPAEFQVLLFMMKNRDRNIERKELSVEALGDRNLSPRIIDSYISALRKKIPFLKDRIESIYAVGYRLKIENTLGQDNVES